MSFTGRQKTFLAIFFIGLVALVVDRTVLRPQGAPGAASADSFHPSDDSILPLDNIPVLEGQVRQNVVERLDRMWSEGGADFERMRDPFSLPASWLDNVAADGQKMPDPAALFARRHKLQAVVMDGDQSYALVDDQFLVPGQVIGGFVLLSVGDRSAVFQGGGKQVVLELASE